MITANFGSKPIPTWRFQECRRLLFLYRLSFFSSYCSLVKCVYFFDFNPISRIECFWGRWHLWLNSWIKFWRNLKNCKWWIQDVRRVLLFLIWFTSKSKLKIIFNLSFIIIWFASDAGFGYSNADTYGVFMVMKDLNGVLLIFIHFQD